MCNRCGNEICECARKASSWTQDQRSVKSKATGVTYYLCAWDDGCNMPVRTNPSGGGETLCRWHKECTRMDNPASASVHFATFESWLVNMQHQYPSRGAWSWESNRLWPVMTGTRMAL